jgi:hypothetical protein
MNAPEQAFIRRRHSRIALGEDKLRFPAQGWAEIGMIRIEAVRFLKRR